MLCIRGVCVKSAYMPVCWSTRVASMDSSDSECEEVLRVPGSPQPEARRVRGSWRDYLDPAEDARIVRDLLEPPRLEYFDSSNGDTECLSCDSSEFEPFSEDDELSDMDLALFEPGPAGTSEEETCARCCANCLKQREETPTRKYTMPPPNLYILTPVRDTDVNIGKLPL